MSETISFKNYPANQRTHGVFAEIDPQNTAGVTNQRTLILGQKTAAGTMSVSLPYLASGPVDAKSAAGVGSVLALMYAQYYAQDSTGEVWLLPQVDDPASVAATGSLAFTGSPTANGTLSIYIAGVLFPLAVAIGMTATAIATAYAALINGLPDCPVSAVATAGSVALTADNKGPVGNELDLRINYRGTAGGEVTPAGLTVAIVGMTGGTQNPTTAVSAGLLALGDTAFDYIVCPYTDAATLNALAAFLNDTVGRWSWQQMLYGGVFTAVRGTAATLTTFGLTRNDYTMTCMGFYDSPTPAWLWAADYAGASAVSLKADPALPLQELVLNVLAPPIPSRFPIGVRNTLLFDGISTFVVGDGQQVVIDRAITFYQLNTAGGPDITWLNVETPYSLVDLVRDMVAYLKASYGRKKLVADGSNIAGGSNQVTAQGILSAVLARYQGYCNEGRAQNYAAFKAGAAAQNAGGGRVNILLPLQLPDQLRQLVMKVNFVANG